MLIGERIKPDELDLEPLKCFVEAYQESELKLEKLKEVIKDSKQIIKEEAEKAFVRSQLQLLRQEIKELGQIVKKIEAED